MSERGPIARRRFLVGAGLAGTAVASGLTPANPATPAVAQTPANAAELPPQRVPLLTLTATEHAFLSAAADTMIPADNCRLRPASAASPISSIASSPAPMAKVRGSTARDRSPKAKPEHGYQLSLIRASSSGRHRLRQRIARKGYGKDFDRLTEEQTRAALKAMEEGKANLGDLERMFFNALLEITMEGFFADPIMAATATWRRGRWWDIPACRRPTARISRRISARATQAPRRSRISPERRGHDNKLKEADAVVIGVGWTGSILARELPRRAQRGGLSAAGSACPRGFHAADIRDDLKYAVRQELFQDPELETVTMRHAPRRRPCRSVASARSCRARAWAAPARIGTA